MRVRNKKGQLSAAELQAIEEELITEIDDSDFVLENYYQTDFQDEDDDDEFDDFDDFIDDWH